MRGGSVYARWLSFVVLVVLVLAGFALGAVGNLSISRVTASQNTVAGGRVITIAGKGFVRVESVKLEGLSLNFMVVSPSEITATVPTSVKRGKLVVTIHHEGASTSALFVARSGGDPST